MNGLIIRHLAVSGPSVIFSIAKELAKQSERKVHYSTVNRRIHGLESRAYVRKYGTQRTKAGAYSDVYFTTIKGDFAALALDLSPSEQLKLLDNAGAKQGSPFLLMKRLVAKGLPLDFVQRELLDEVTIGVKDGYINLEVLDKEVICSAFAALIARRLRLVLGEERGKEYAKTVLEVLESIILHPFATEVTGELYGVGPSSSSLAGSDSPVLRKALPAREGILETNRDSVGLSPTVAIEENVENSVSRETQERQMRIMASSRYSSAWLRELYHSIKDMVAAHN